MSRFPSGDTTLLYNLRGQRPRQPSPLNPLNLHAKGVPCNLKGGLFLNYNKNIITLVASMFLVASGYTMVIPFLPLYLGELGVPDNEISFWTGIVFSSCFLVAGVMGPVWGKLADSGGKKKMAVRAAVLLGFSYLFCGLCQNQYHLMAARAFQGFANGFVAASMAIISDSTESDKLGATLGMAQTSLVVGGILGPLMGGALSHVFGMRDTFFLSALFLWIVAAAVICFVRDKKHAVKKGGEKTSIGADLSYVAHKPSLRELLMLCFFLQTTILMIQPVTSLYVGELMHHEGNIELTAGFIMSSGGLAGALTTTLWGNFGQEKGYYRAMTVTLLAAGVITILQSIPDSIWGFGLCQFLVGCFVIGVNPSLNAALVEHTPSDFRGRIFGLSTAAQQFGNMLGPLLSSAVSMAFGIWEVYLTAGIIQLLLGLKVWVSHGRGDRR